MIRRGLIVLGIAGSIVVLVTFTQMRGEPSDAFAYWSADAVAPYSPRVIDGPGGPGPYAFVYPPPALAVATLGHALAFEWFVAVVRALELAALAVLTGPALIVALFLPPIASEINAGNINLLIALAVVAGFRWPIAWTFILLTKPSVGIGTLWFLIRGDRRGFLLAVGPAAVISAISFVVAPELWFDWIRLLTGFGDSGGWPFPWPIWVRLPFALALVVWGARTDRRWAVALGSFFALPRLYFMSPAMLVGLLPLVRVWPRQRATSPAAA